MYGARKAFTLVECLVVLCIMGILYGVLLISQPDNDRLKGIAAARQAKTWISDKMTRSLYSGKDFTLYCSAADLIPYIEIRFEGQTVREKFSSSNAWFITGGTNYAFTYSPQTHTLSPAATINIYHTTSLKLKPIAKLVISVHGNVTLTETP